MNFDDVEKARVAYHTKYSKLQKRALIIYAVLFGAALMMVITMVSPDFSSIMSNLGGNLIFGGVFLFAGLFVPSVFYAIIALIIIGHKTNKEKIAYERAYRAYFVERVLAATFTDLYHRHDEGLSKEKLRSTLMIDTGDRYRSNDYTRGKYKNVAFEQADVHIQEEHKDSDGDTTYVTTFRGRFMIFEFPKKFQSRLLVAGSGARVARVSMGAEFRALETESNEFNRRFRILAEDGFEMFYLLDPAMMTRMEVVADAYNNRVMFGFCDNRVIVGINDGKDALEPPSASKSLDEKTEMEKNLKDVKVITDLVDTLRLSRG